MQVQFSLADGGTASVQRDELRGLYDELWLLTDIPGAVSAAAKVKHAEWVQSGDNSHALDRRESAALLKALQRLGRNVDS